MKNYVQFGTDLALEAGEIMLKYFATDVKKEWKEDKTPVTIADITINKLVIESILKQYPTHGILGEEESFMQDSEYVWVCDPLDGTFPFSHGIPTFTFSLALTHNGVPVVGIIYDPIMKRMYTAEKGKGTYLNGKQMFVSRVDSFEMKIIGMEGSQTSYFNPEKLRTLLLKKGVRIFTPGSFTYSGVSVVRGDFIAACYSKHTPWDGAALKILIDEAGGKTTDLFGNEQRYDKELKGFIGSNGILHDQLLELVNQALGQ